MTEGNRVVEVSAGEGVGGGGAKGLFGKERPVCWGGERYGSGKRERVMLEGRGKIKAW